MPNMYPSQKFAEACEWLVGSEPLRWRLEKCTQHILILSTRPSVIPPEKLNEFNGILDGLRNLSDIPDDKLDELSSRVFGFCRELP